MTAEIDLLKFEAASGHLKFLPAVALGFLRQLPQWHLDFEAALASHNAHAQEELLHKIKGACYAVAAYDTVEVVNQAEAAHGRGEPLLPADLLAHLQRVEVELQAIVANAPPK